MFSKSQELKWRSHEVEPAKQASKLGGSGGMLPRENFENLVKICVIWRILGHTFTVEKTCFHPTRYSTQQHPQSKSTYNFFQSILRFIIVVSLSEHVIFSTLFFSFFSLGSCAINILLATITSLEKN